MTRRHRGLHAFASTDYVWISLHIVMRSHCQLQRVVVGNCHDGLVLQMQLLSLVRVFVKALHLLINVPSDVSKGLGGLRHSLSLSEHVAQFLM